MVTETPSRPPVPPSIVPQEDAPDCKFVGRDEFCELAISTKSLIRWDDPEKSIRGLFDPATGIRYAIAEGNLFLS